MRLASFEDFELRVRHSVRHLEARAARGPLFGGAPVPPRHLATLTPEHAARLLGPAAAARGEALTALLPRIVLPVCLCGLRVHPLQRLGGAALRVVESAPQHAHAGVRLVLLVKGTPIHQPLALRRRQSVDVIAQTLALELAGSEGARRIAAGKERVATARGVKLAAAHVVHAAQHREPHPTRLAAVGGQLIGRDNARGGRRAPCNARADPRSRAERNRCAGSQRGHRHSSQEPPEGGSARRRCR
mmetsp:Transcript_1413/g.4162  ORF Transcript_1413/g.4162 Transcript_1413/m.4162 type:complete len:245 (+) Transcript_1413:129-863(+)